MRDVSKRVCQELLATHGGKAGPQFKNVNFPKVDDHGDRRWSSGGPNPVQTTSPNHPPAMESVNNATGSVDRRAAPLLTLVSPGLVRTDVPTGEPHAVFRGLTQCGSNLGHPPDERLESWP